MYSELLMMYALTNVCRPARNRLDFKVISAAIKQQKRTQTLQASMRGSASGMDSDVEDESAWDQSPSVSGAGSSSSARRTSSCTSKDLGARLTCRIDRPTRRIDMASWKTRNTHLLSECAATPSSWSSGVGTSLVISSAAWMTGTVHASGWRPLAR